MAIKDTSCWVHPASLLAFLATNLSLYHFFSHISAGVSGTPSITDWFGKVLKSGDRIGVDPTLFGISRFQDYEEKLQKFGITLVPLERNLIDVIWTTATGRPQKQNTSLLVLEMKFAGTMIAKSSTCISNQSFRKGLFLRCNSDEFGLKSCR